MSSSAPFRWHLVRDQIEPGAFMLCVEERNTRGFGIIAYVRDRREARRMLPQLRAELARRISRLGAPVKTYSPEEA